MWKRAHILCPQISLYFSRSACDVCDIIDFGNCNGHTACEGTISGGQKIRSDLFGLFFEHVSYSADGGLNALLTVINGDTDGEGI